MALQSCGRFFGTQETVWPRGRKIGPEKLKGVAVEAVASRLGLDRYHTAGRPSKFRGIRRSQYLELLHRVHAGSHGDVLRTVGGGLDSINHDRIAVAALA